MCIRPAATTPALPREVAFLTSAGAGGAEYPDILRLHERENVVCRATYGCAASSTASAARCANGQAARPAARPTTTTGRSQRRYTLRNDPLLRACAMEVSSMGIRVDARSADRASVKASAGREDCVPSRPFHRALLAGELPLDRRAAVSASRACACSS